MRDRRARATVITRQTNLILGLTWTSKIYSDARTNFRSESSWCGAIFDVARSRATIASLEEKTSHPDFWQDQEQAQKILQQRKAAEEIVASDEKLARMLSDIETYFHLAQEETDVTQRDSLLQDIEREIAAADAYVSELETITLLSGENDKLNAIMTIKPGAGGTESQDWAEMLLHMYFALGGTKRLSRNCHGPYAGRGRGAQIRHGPHRGRKRHGISCHGERACIA